MAVERHAQQYEAGQTAGRPNLRSLRSLGDTEACLGAKTVPTSSAEATAPPEGLVVYTRIPFARRIRAM